MDHKKHKDVLIICDACVLIDVEQSGLTAAMFSLPYQFAVPDTLYEKELSENHSKLLQFGLIKKSMSGEQMLEVQNLSQQYSHLSSNDCSACIHAKHEKSFLLTNDKRLRGVAESLNVEAHGTIWLVEQMIDHEKISIDEAHLAFQCMIDSGSFLPREEFEKMIQRKEKEAKGDS